MNNRTVTTPGEAHRALHENRAWYIAQSREVRFGLLPERQIDVSAFAALVRRTYPETRQ